MTNRRRDEPRTPASVIFSVILAFAIIAGGGVLHAFYKNRQIQIGREIDAIDRQMEHSRLDIRTTEMRMDQLLDRYTICKQLKENGSDMRSISLAVVEEINPAPPARRSVASAAP